METKKAIEYICVNEYEEIALYYLKDIGRRRVYRQSFPLEPFYFNGEDINKSLKLFKYKRKSNAQKLCDYINSIQSMKFIVKEVNE